MNPTNLMIADLTELAKHTYERITREGFKGNLEDTTAWRAAQMMRQMKEEIRHLRAENERLRTKVQQLQEALDKAGYFKTE